MYKVRFHLGRGKNFMKWQELPTWFNNKFGWFFKNGNK